MKVTIGPYKNWFGPYQLAEKLCFWAKDEIDEYGSKNKPDWVYKFGEWLAHGEVLEDNAAFNLDRHQTWLYKFLTWVHSKQTRKVSVKIDKYDTWSMDDTLAHIVLPMLKQLKNTKHGTPYVDPTDCPEHLKPKSQTLKEIEEQQLDSTHFERWDWVLDEMIFAFQNKLDDSWQEQFESGNTDLRFEPEENGMSRMVHGPNHTKQYDVEGRQLYQSRISKGFLLFGKYYEALWD